MELLQELKKVVLSEAPMSTIYCTTFEDNKSCIYLVKTPHMIPRTKHISLKYYHFRVHVQSKTISIKYIETILKCAYIFPKALNYTQFTSLRKLINGW